MLENDSKTCILEMSNLGPEWSSPGLKLCLQKEPFGYVKNRRPNSRIRRPNCVTAEKIKRLFHGSVMFQFFRDAFHYKLNLVSDDYVCRNKTLCIQQGLETNIQTRVYREFLLATNTRVEIVLIHLEQNTIRIESLGHVMRLGLG